MVFKDKLKKFAAPILGGVVLAAGVTGAGFTQVFAATKPAVTAVTQTATEQTTAASTDITVTPKIQNQTAAATTTVTVAPTDKSTDEKTSFDSETEDAALAAQAAITKDTAILAATKANSGFTAASAVLGDENGTLVYEIKMTDAAGKDMEVKVDATTGVILTSENDAEGKDENTDTQKNDTEKAAAKSGAQSNSTQENENDSGTDNGNIQSEG